VVPRFKSRPRQLKCRAGWLRARCARCDQRPARLECRNHANGVALDANGAVRTGAAELRTEVVAFTATVSRQAWRARMIGPARHRPRALAPRARIVLHGCGQRSDNLDASRPNSSLATVLMLSTVRARRFLTSDPARDGFQARAVSPPGCPAGPHQKDGGSDAGRRAPVSRATLRPGLDRREGARPSRHRETARAAPRRILKSLARSRSRALACRRVRGLIRRDLDAPSVLAAM
jgi:hypothetical protein